MNRHAFSAFLAVALLFMFSTITASAQQSRAVPPNDNLGNAKPIKIGKDYTVPDIGAATNEAGEPTTICEGGAIPHSVWFTFTQPVFTRLYLSTFGTRLVSTVGHDITAVLAIYEITGGVFTERICAYHDSDMPFAQIEFQAAPGVTYYIAAGTTFNEPYGAGSTLKLNTRVLRTIVNPPNNDFETPVNGSNWKLKNGGDDGIVCANASYPAVSGSCAFRFNATRGVTTTLTQTMPFPTTFQPRKNGLLSTVFFFRVMDTAVLTKTKIKVVIRYSDGTRPTVFTGNLNGTVASGTYQSRLYWHALKSNKVSSIKFEMKLAAPTGTLLVDAVLFSYQADVLTRSDGRLPVPAAVGEKQ